MRRIRGSTYPEDEIQAEVTNIIAMIRIEQELEGAGTWKDCFQGTDLRRTHLTVFTIVCQEFSGISFLAASVHAHQCLGPG